MSMTRDFERREVAWYAVRCCCQPTSIFGFLPLKVGYNRVGQSVFSHTIKDERGRDHFVELRQIQQSGCRTDVPQAVDVIEREMAVYSDDRPLSFWRTIPGFLEVVGAVDIKEDHDLPDSILHDMGEH